MLNIKLIQLLQFTTPIDFFMCGVDPEISAQREQNQKSNYLFCYFWKKNYAYA